MPATTPPWKLPLATDGDDSQVDPTSSAKVIPKIELTCPECGHVQSEPERVVSTQCRGCLKHYQVRDGKVVARAISAMRLAKPGAHAQLSQEKEEPPQPATRPTKPKPLRMVWWKRMILRPEPPLAVCCFECSRAFTASAEAESTQCPQCGSYASLRNYEIRESWARELKTCGDLVLHKDGNILQTRIQCRNLTVFGKIAAAVVCSGDVVIHPGAKITGAIRCRKLRVLRKAKVEFHDVVEADEIIIEGEARGVFHCKGMVTLGRRALLQGLVRASMLNVRPGASHVGTFETMDPGDDCGSTLAETTARN